MRISVDKNLRIGNSQQLDVENKIINIKYQNEILNMKLSRIDHRYEVMRAKMSFSKEYGKFKDCKKNFDELDVENEVIHMRYQNIILDKQISRIDREYQIVRERRKENRFCIIF